MTETQLGNKMILKLTILQEGKNNQVREFLSMEELHTFAEARIVKKVTKKKVPVKPKKKTKK